MTVVSFWAHSSQSSSCAWGEKFTIGSEKLDYSQVHCTHYHVFVEDDLGEVVRLAEHVLNVLRAVKTGARVRVGDRLTQQL
jgi:hypothetical protein